MAILVAILSSLATALLVALVAYALGVERHDLLLAIGVIGGGIQLGGLILWYLLVFNAKPSFPSQRRGGDVK